MKPAMFKQSVLLISNIEASYSEFGLGFVTQEVSFDWYDES
jgi:hypothetical protein